MVAGSISPVKTNANWIEVHLTLRTSRSEKTFRFTLPTFAPSSSELVYLLLFPIIAFLGLHYLPRCQNRTLDPYIYTGFINNFTDLFRRYGVTYYGVRFGLILPGRLFTSIFGPEAGYFVLRYLLSLLCGISLYRVCKRYLSTIVAVIVYALAIGTPYFARALLWDHPDATGVPFLTATICLLLLSGERSRVKPFLAGCCAAMAVNSNVFTVALLGIFTVVYVLFSLGGGRGWWEVIRTIVFASLGGFVVTFAGALYYRYTVGHFDIFTITLQTATSLSRGGFKDWRLNGFSWTFNQPQVFLTVWLSLCCLGTLRFRKLAFFPGVVTFSGAGITTFYFVHQFFLEGDSLQLFYYFSYAAPFVFLMLALLLQILWRCMQERPSLFVSIGLAALFLPLIAISLGLTVFHPPFFGTFAELCAVTSAVLFLARFLTWGRLWKTGLALVGSVLLASSFNAAFAGYDHMIQARGSLDTSENDVYRVALAFMKAMPKSTGRPSELLFLYDTREQSLNSIQSTYLWGYSWIKYERGAPPGRESLGPVEVSLLRNDDRYLCLIGESAEDVAQTAEDLKSHDVAFKTIFDRIIASGQYRVFLKLLAIEQAPGPILENGDFEAGVLPWLGGWANLKSVDGGQSGKCLELEAQQGPSQYAMEWRLRRMRPQARYRLTFWVKSGTSGDEPFVVGLWNASDMKWAASQSGRSTRQWTQFKLEFTNTSTNPLSLEIMKNSPTRGTMLFDSLELVSVD